MTQLIDLPPEFERLADLISEQPPKVRDLFRYALVLAMIDDEKARVIGTRVEEEREWMTVETVAGDVVTGQFIWILGGLIVRSSVAFNSVSFNPAERTQLAAKQFGP